MNAADISTLNNLTTLTGNDFFHVLKDGSYGFLFSNKSKLNTILNLYNTSATTTKINNLLTRISSIETKVNLLVNRFETKETLDSTYISKESVSSAIESFLTKDTMDSLISNLVKRNDTREKEELAKKEARKMADEMTDFIGAAMVGIN